MKNGKNLERTSTDNLQTRLSEKFWWKCTREEKAEYFKTNEYSEIYQRLIKLESRAKRMIELTSKCYYTDKGKNCMLHIFFG